MSVPSAKVLHMVHNEHSKKTKIHAQRRDVYRRYPLWAGDDNDWAQMRNLPIGDLICPADGCRAELVTVERQNGTRFLRNRRGTSDCGHAFGRSRGGGPMSLEHRWFQQRIARICASLGYEVVQEHFDSSADVWVESNPPLAIEIQRWPTNFVKRNRARVATGARVIWLFPESGSSPKMSRALFNNPAARIRVIGMDGSWDVAPPWTQGASTAVKLCVGATVVGTVNQANKQRLESVGNYDAKRFFGELLNGDRRWFGPNVRQIKYGAGWALNTEMEMIQAQVTTNPRSDESKKYDLQASHENVVEPFAETVRDAPAKLYTNTTPAADDTDSGKEVVRKLEAEGEYGGFDSYPNETDANCGRESWIKRLWNWIMR